MKTGRWRAIGRIAAVCTSVILAGVYVCCYQANGTRMSGSKGMEVAPTLGGEPAPPVVLPGSKSAAVFTPPPVERRALMYSSKSGPIVTPPQDARGADAAKTQGGFSTPSLNAAESVQMIPEGGGRTIQPRANQAATEP